MAIGKFCVQHGQVTQFAGSFDWPPAGGPLERDLLRLSGSGEGLLLLLGLES